MTQPATDPERSAAARTLIEETRGLEDPERALVGWRDVREALRPRPRLGELADEHLEAHLAPLALAGEAVLPMGRAEVIYEEGTALARELRNSGAVARLEQAFADYLTLRGYLRAACVHARRARDLAERLGDPAAATTAEASLAWATLWLPGEPRPLLPAPAARAPGAAHPDAVGERRRAQAALARSAAWCQTNPISSTRPAWQGALAWAAGTALEARVRAEAAHFIWLAGEPRLAARWAGQALDARVRPDALAARPAALGVLAVARLDLEDPTAAREAALEAAGWGRRLELAEGWLPLEAIAAEALAACGDDAGARALLAPAARGRARRETSLAREVREARAWQRLGARDAGRRCLARAHEQRAADPWGDAWRPELARLASRLEADAAG